MCGNPDSSRVTADPIVQSARQYQGSDQRWPVYTEDQIVTSAFPSRGTGEPGGHQATITQFKPAWKHDNFGKGGFENTNPESRTTQFPEVQAMLRKP